jgi:two-component system, probable response regulator PhcQ
MSLMPSIPLELIVTAKSAPIVLYVDDEPLSQKYFASAIAPFAEVLTASDPIAARKILAERQMDISVVVSDERMPLETGVPFLTDVRKSWPGVRRVLTSAYADLDNLQQAINDAAICQFVPKPWDIEQLCSAVREALAPTHPVDMPNPELANFSRDAMVSELALSFDGPLRAIQQDTMRIMVMSGTAHLPATAPSTAGNSLWATQRTLGQISAAAARLHQTTSACLEYAAALVAATSKSRRLH